MPDPKPARPHAADAVPDPDVSVARALALLAPKARGPVSVSDLGPERDITDEPQRIGVFVCGCDGEISGIIDTSAVAAHARSLPFVVLSETQGRLCDSEGRALMGSRIAEHRLNRIVVAACTPRTHELLFRDVVRAAGLNRHLLTLVNLRSGCAWVHAGSPVQASAKARELIAMATYRAACSEPLPDRTVPTHRSALVVGGQMGGLTAALALAERGVLVHLVERAERLAEGLTCPQDQGVEAARLIQAVSGHRRITLHVASEVVRVDGQAGHFASHLSSSGKTAVVHHGVIVVDLEASEHTAVPLHGDGRCPKARTRLAPIELASEGLFACGNAFGLPTSEAMAKAHALSVQAAAILDRRETSLDVLAVRVDPTRCAKCMTCLRICPEHAPRVGQHGKAEIQEALCVSCGTCVAACPARALTLPGYSDAQIQAAVCGLLRADLEPFTSYDERTEPTGISWARWSARAQRGSGAPEVQLTPQRRQR